MQGGSWIIFDTPIQFLGVAFEIEDFPAVSAKHLAIFVADDRAAAQRQDNFGLLQSLAKTFGLNIAIVRLSMLQKDIPNAHAAGLADDQIVDIHKFGPEPIGDALADGR